MSHRTYELLSGVLFLFIAIAHMVRVMLRTAIVAEGIHIPVWWSAVAVVISGYLAWQGIRLWRNTATLE